MQELINTEDIKIEDMIYEIRGKQVMLDRDIAKQYNVETKALNQAMKRNIKRFPDEFCFKLSTVELYKLFSRSRFVTLNKNGDLRGNNIKYLPYAFTEQGVAMLATILKSDEAIEMSIKIMNAFVSMRRYISSNLIDQKFINNQVMTNTENIKLLQESFDKLEAKEINNHLFYDGQIYDAYSVVIDIFNRAKKNNYNR